MAVMAELAVMDEVEQELIIVAEVVVLEVLAVVAELWFCFIVKLLIKPQFKLLVESAEMAVRLEEIMVALIHQWQVQQEIMEMME